jgi:Tfp pilus assembly protein PilX
MEAVMMSSKRIQQRGLALPVMLIILVVMLISGAYLLKSSNSTTMTTSNLAYESALNKAADLGLLTGFEWLSSTANTNKVLLDANSSDNGYVATLDTTQNVRSDGFWSGKRSITTADGLTIDYVIHRMCSQAAAWNAGSNRCMQTTPSSFALGSSVGLGSSLSSNALALTGSTQLHYIITARIAGPRGGNVINQLAVLIGV